MENKTIGTTAPSQTKENAEDTHGRIVHLNSTIQNLRRTRVLLLPRLLSGQVELAVKK